MPRELEEALRVAQESLKKRHPNSVAALLQATHLAEMEADTHTAEAKRKIEQLQSELRAQEESHNLSLRSLRQVPLLSNHIVIAD